MLALVAPVLGFAGPFSLPASQAQSDAAKQSTATSSSCPKCKGSMESGVLLDYINSAVSRPDRWSPGDVPKLDFFGKEDRVTRKIEAYRCSGCGYLELYAK
jgi:Domain of unknown function (DUF6487)